MFKLRWMKHPITAFIGMIIGALIGVFYKDVTHFLAPFGELYLSFLKMLVIPIMVTAVITSLGKLLASQKAKHYLKRLIITFLISLTFVSAVGIIIGLIGQSGSNLDDRSREVLGSTIMDEEATVTKSFSDSTEITVMDFLKTLIPTNIFESLVGEQNLQVLFVAIVFGIAIGTIRETKRDEVIALFDVVFKSFEKMIAWTMYGLPFGLLCIIANQFSTMGMELLYSMTKFIIIIYISCLLLIILSGCLIWKLKGHSISRSTADLKEPLLIAFGTRNSLAAMPSIFQVLQKEYKLKKESVSLVVPLSIIICRYSMVIVFTIGTIFVAQLYSIPLGFSQLILILFGAIFAAIAGAGAPALVSLSMITLILGPLGIPSETAIVLLIAVTPIIDPILTMLNVHLTCTSTVLIDKPAKKDLPLEQEKYVPYTSRPIRAGGE